MAIRQILGKIRRSILSTVSRRDFSFRSDSSLVSFTFDDFPQSALHLGGSILKRYGARGTYYASMGLVNETNALGQHFCAEDLQNLLRDGHELGSHTFSHSSCRASMLEDFRADAIKGKRAIETVTGCNQPHPFSYPFGHATWRAKSTIGRSFASCRGITPGVNTSPADLNLLKANCLYSHSFDLSKIKQLFKTTEECRGWLIFYTHDIAETPSDFGCTPAEFENVVKLATERRSRILPVGEAISGAINS